MILTNPVFKENINVITHNGDTVKFYTNRIHTMLLSLTDDPVVIKRAEPLIFIQLASYSTIKEYELNYIIYRSLEQLRYKNIANRYYDIAINNNK